MHRVNDLGYGKNAKDATMDNLQPIPTGFQVYGYSSTTKR
jgi:type IV secretory pathway component VirB8